MHKLSVITVNLNNADGLRKTIESVVNQTYTNFEYIIIDGGSTDGSLEVIKEYVDRIAYWISEPDRGIYNAMNKGIRNANGDFVCFLNSGDEYYSKYSIEYISKFLISVEPMIYFSNNLFIDLEEDNLKLIDSKRINDRSDLLRFHFGHASTFYDRKLFSIIGEFNSKNRIVSDVDWYMDALINKKIPFKCINFVTSIFYSGGISSSLDIIHRSERKEMIKKYFKDYEIKIFSGRVFRVCNNTFIIKWLFQKIFNLKLNKISTK
jgi:glycosyltransferase involved in cell wall biosynthesis